MNGDNTRSDLLGSVQPDGHHRVDDRGPVMRRCAAAILAASIVSAGIPADLLKKWRAAPNRALFAVAEVIRRAFNLKRNGVHLLLENLKKIYRLRDLALHLSGKVQEAVSHSELVWESSRRFVYLRADISEGASTPQRRSYGTLLSRETR